MQDYTDLRDQLAVYLTQAQIAQVSEAYALAAEAHSDQRRMTGEPYVTHPLEVARILAGMHMDSPSIIAALLHDVIEDTPITKADIAKQFGDEVADLVDGVSKLTQIEFNSKREAQAENFRKMMLAMIKDIRVILIKLADRLHNMRTIAGMSLVKRRQKALETLEIYAPIAARLGMNSFRIELEELGFCAYYPMRYRVLKESVRKARGNRREIIQTIEETLKTCLNNSNIAAYTIWGREKHLYSLYKKMKIKRVSFIEVMDMYAFRIIVDSVDVCYRVLGNIHAVYKPMPGRFKDYIALPKANGYQSLHTILLGPYGVPIEVQIRTEKMEQMAESGIAAHWMYKTGESDVEVEQQIRTREWVKGLVELQDNVGDSLEFIESVKLDLYPEDVYVFTPKGKILSLPKGSTPVDFAYAIHTDIGNTCIAAKINRKLAPLSTRLVTGGTIEVLCAPDANPNPAWLSLVVTGKAKSNIRSWLKQQKLEQSIALGKRMLERAMLARKLQIDIIAPELLAGVLESLKIENLSDLYEAIGLGAHMASFVAQRLAGEQKAQEETPVLKASSLAIQGTEGMVLTYAKCCYPIPGDPIVGYLSAGRGVMIHAEHCQSIRAFLNTPEKCVPVRWAEEVNREFPVEVQVDVQNSRGALANMASIIAEADSNIMGINLEDRDARQTTVNFILLVKGRQHLAQIMRRLRHCHLVLRIMRAK